LRTEIEISFSSIYTGSCKLISIIVSVMNNAAATVIAIQCNYAGRDWVDCAYSSGKCISTSHTIPYSFNNVVDIRNVQQIQIEIEITFLMFNTDWKFQIYEIYRF